MDRVRSSWREEASRAGAAERWAFAATRLLLGLACLALASAAASAPVDLRFTGSLGVVDDEGVTTLAPPEEDMFTDTSEEFLSLEGSAEMEEVTLGSGTDADPHRAVQEWTVTNVTDVTRDEPFVIEELWVSFLGHFDEEDPFYDDLGSDLGLQVDEAEDWRLLRGAETGKLFPSKFVGDLAPGVSKTLTTDYIVATELTVDGGDRVWPNLRTGFALAPIPEPGTAALLAAGLTGLAAAGRRRC